MKPKSLGKNAFFNVLYKCFNFIFPLITSIYVARVLLPVGVGKVNSAQNTVQYFIIFASLGLPTYGVKKIAEARGDIQKRSKTFFELFLINGIASIVCSLIYIAFAFFRFAGTEKLALALVVGLKLYFNIINIDWFYQGVEEYKYIMLRSLFVKLLSLIAVFVFVRTEADYLAYAAISTLSLVINYVFNTINLRKYIIRVKEKLSVYTHLKPILYLLAASIAIEVYTLADVSMLNIMKGDTVVGYYTTAIRVVSMVRTLVTAVCAVFLPRMSSMFSEGNRDGFISLANKGLAVIFSISIPVALGLCLTSNESILLLFGSEYASSIVTMMILCISIITVAMSNFTGYQVLITLGKEKLVLISTIIGAIINVVLNYILIRPLDQNGAAIASVVTEGFIAIFQYCMVKKEINISFDKKTLYSVLVPAFLMCIVVVIIHCSLSNIWVKTFFEVGIGAFIYIALSYKLGNTLVNTVISKVVSKIRRGR